MTKGGTLVQLEGDIQGFISTYNSKGKINTPITCCLTMLLFLLSWVMYFNNYFYNNTAINNTLYYFTGTKLELEQEIRAMVLWLDVANNRAELSLRTDVLKNVSRIQGLLTFYFCKNLCIIQYYYFLFAEDCTQPAVSCVYRGEVIFYNESFVIYSLKGQCHGVLAYAPSKQHINDILPPCHKIGETKKVIITK